MQVKTFKNWKAMTAKKVMDSLGLSFLEWARLPIKAKEFFETDMHNYYTCTEFPTYIEVCDK